ncbi:MAG: hypothetical protein OEU93_01385 [Rubrivivax sp.]|nr:hypothetical protein [Rubrivivax sp.]
MNPRSGSSIIALAAATAMTSGQAAAQQDTAPAHPQTSPTSAPSPGAADSTGSSLFQGEGLIVLDYQVIPVPQQPSIDLMGFHILNKVADGLYVGVGVNAPVRKGEYGGFMAFDVGATVQRRIWGRLFANAGLALGGGGGGKSNAQSIELSGTGGLFKAYAGLGVEFDGFSVGANATHVKFTHAAIDHAQLNLFVQAPFSYTVGPFARFGERLSAADAEAAFTNSSANVLTLGLDNFRQIEPQGSNKSTIRVADLQFAHYLSDTTYWYASLGVGYRGLPLYNHFIGGVGYRFDVAPRISLQAQVGLGSGGYAPEQIDTGAGMLVYPKVSAEYAITKAFGLALTAGYLLAPDGSSKNYTFGAALNYHLQSQRQGTGAGGTPDGAVFRGYRFSLLQQTETSVRVRDLGRSNINMLSAQLDTMVSDHFYIPIRAGVAYTAYLGYPGYGELLVGVGMQTKYNRGDRFQFFGQLLGGANVHGLIVTPGIGVNYTLSDRLALHASTGKTMATSSDNGNFSSTYLGLGLTYRFSAPSW